MLVAYRVRPSGSTSPWYPRRAAIPAQPMAMFVCPVRQARPNVSEMTTATSTPAARVRAVDAGVGADEAVVRLGDQHAPVHAHDAPRLVQHHLDVAGVLA